MLILVASVLFIYAHTAKYGFIGWDDDKDVLNKPRIQQLTPASVMHLFNPLGIFQGQYYYEYFPITDLTYMLEWHFYGRDFPQGFHLDNVLLDLSDVLLVFAAMILLLDTVRPEQNNPLPQSRGRTRPSNIPSSRETTAFFAALLFAVHPLMVENTAWLSGRKDLLVMFFYLLWFIFYIRSDTKNTGRMLHLSLAFFCYILALLSKFQAVTIPGVLAAYELLINRNSLKHTIKRLTPYASVLLIYVPYTMWYYNKGATAFVYDYGPLWTVLFIPEAIFIYLRKFLLPFNLTPVYLVPTFTDTGLLSVSLVFLGLLVLWVMRLFKRKEFLLLFGLSWFAANFIPVSNIVSLPTKMADRYMYEASFGIFLIAALWMSGLSGSVWRKRTVLALYAIVFALLAFLSFRQSLRWKNSYSLWSYTVELQPYSAVARNNIGVYYKDHGQPQLAEQEYKLALRYDHFFVPSLWNLGIMYLDKNEYKKAFPLFLRMSEIKAPERYMACRAVGALYLKFYNDPAAAKKYFEMSYRLNPHQPDVKTLKAIIQGL